MHLILDIGNTRIKGGIFEQAHLTEAETFTAMTPEDLTAWVQPFRISRAMISATGSIPEWLPGWLDAMVPWMELDHHTPLPFTNAYRTPETLGRDRIAGLAGALALGYQPPFLVIDAGTCITVDLLEEGLLYRGGSISPGLRMRLQAMHSFTARLPLAEWQDDPPWPGTDTAGALLAGAQWGGICELEGMITRYRQKHPNLNVIVTGGDLVFLANHLNSVIFAHPELVLIGLNQILTYAFDAG
ncbi:MAG: type III pantothenate kinase [Saprospiraceae bacterium]